MSERTGELPGGRILFDGDEPPAPRWYRSLYWRAAIALIAVVAVLLAAEAALLLWFTAGIGGALPGDPRQMGRIVAEDVGMVLERDPSTDLRQYLQERYGHYYQTILVVMRDGRDAANHDDVERDLLENGRLTVERMRRFEDRTVRPGPGRGGSDPRFGDGGRGFSGDPFFGRRRRASGDGASVIVNGLAAGRVFVQPGNPPFSRVVRVVGPRMAVVASGVLLAGGGLIALMVFGPARRRLLQVQEATERLGGGDLHARALEGGGDEVAAVARSFNRMADELTRRARALEASDRARRHLLADVSHELMTPLTAMRGYIETLGMGELQLDPQTRERYLRIIGEETTRLENLIGDLLDLARLEGGGSSLRRERTPVAMLFRRVAERHEQELTRRRITLDETIAPGSEEIVCDPDRLEQALQNLVANGLRYTPDAGRIGLASSRRDGRVILAVRDSGPGIADDQLPLIFDRFYKGDASRRAAGGSGLGLSIVKAIIERHGGTIAVRNDDGAVFEISLPLN